MHLQEWYDDDNEDYDANSLKTAIKEEHGSLQASNVFTRVQATDYDQQRLKEVIQTKWKVNIDEIYAATPAAMTLRILLTLAASTITQPQHIHVRHTISIPQYTTM
eukprot:962964-Amphidinium_carterae.2